MQRLTLSETITQLEDLLNTGQGDTGRLQHIYDMLASDKPLYRSDAVYLESKLQHTVPKPDTIQKPPEPLPKETVTLPKESQNLK